MAGKVVLTEKERARQLRLAAASIESALFRINAVCDAGTELTLENGAFVDGWLSAIRDRALWTAARLMGRT